MEKEKNTTEEIKKCKFKRKILNRTITTYLKEITDSNRLDVEAGTDGYQGGDGGHGGRTYFSIRYSGGTCFTVNEVDHGFEVILLGDSELRTTIQALKFILKVLEEGEQ